MSKHKQGLWSFSCQNTHKPRIVLPIQQIHLNKQNMSLQIQKFFSHSLKEKALMLVSFLFDTVWVGNHVHFTFITKHLTPDLYSSYKTVSSIFTIQCFWESHTTLEWKHRGKELIAAAIIVQAGKLLLSDYTDTSWRSLLMWWHGRP